MLEIGEGARCRASFGGDDDGVPLRQIRLHLGEQCPQPSFHQIARDGIAHALAHDETILVVRCRSRAPAQDERGAMHRAARRAHRREIARGTQAFGSSQASTVRRQRPLARRDFSTRRPLRVAIRFMKPCVRSRGIRLG